jgi:Zn finger protein HypA/HybF involved in hydrogenase expression
MNEKTELKNIALKIYDLGYHIVPVNKNKEPLCKWEKILERKELENLLDRAEAIALVCGEIHPFKNEGYLLVSIDIDNPEVLSIEPLRNLLEKTFFTFTGPRCPFCRSKRLTIIEEGRKFKCDECDTEFSITALQAEASRGRAIFIFVHSNVIKKYLRKTKFGDLELLIHNYQVFLGKHTSGINYEPINLKLDRKDLGIIFVEEDYFLQILNSIEEYVRLKKLREKKEQLEGVNAEKIKEVGIELRELSTEEIDTLASILKEIYKKGNRQYIWLYFSGWCAKACIHPLSCLKVLYKIYRDVNDEENIKTRASAIVYSYYKAGIAVNKKDFVSIIGVEPYGPTEKINEFENLIKKGKLKGKSGLFEIFLSYFY